MDCCLFVSIYIDTVVIVDNYVITFVVLLFKMHFALLHHLIDISRQQSSTACMLDITCFYCKLDI